MLLFHVEHPSTVNTDAGMIVRSSEATPRSPSRLYRSTGVRLVHPEPDAVEPTPKRLLGYPLHEEPRRRTDDQPAYSPRDLPTLPSKGRTFAPPPGGNSPSCSELRQA